jgi:hypothetical protein
MEEIVCQCNTKLRLPEDVGRLLKESKGLWGVCPNPDCGLILHMKFNGQSRCKSIVYHQKFPLEALRVGKKNIFIRLEPTATEEEG